jgi:hypothetical protein
MQLDLRESEGSAKVSENTKDCTVMCKSKNQVKLSQKMKNVQ